VSIRAFFRFPEFQRFLGHCLSDREITDILAMGRERPGLNFVLFAQCCLQLRPTVAVTAEREDLRRQLADIQESLRAYRAIPFPSVMDMLTMRRLESEARRLRGVLAAPVADVLRDQETGTFYGRLFGQVRGPRVYSPRTGKLLGRPRIWVDRDMPRALQEVWFSCFRPKAKFDRLEGIIYYDYKSPKPYWSRHLEVRVRISVQTGRYRGEDTPKDELEEIWREMERYAEAYVSFLYSAELVSMMTKSRKGIELLEAGVAEEDPVVEVFDERGYHYDSSTDSEFQAMGGFGEEEKEG